MGAYTFVYTLPVVEVLACAVCLASLIRLYPLCTLLQCTFVSVQPLAFWPEPSGALLACIPVRRYARAFKAAAHLSRQASAWGRATGTVGELRLADVTTVTVQGTPAPPCTKTCMGSCTEPQSATSLAPLMCGWSCSGVQLHSSQPRPVQLTGLVPPALA